MSDIKAVLWDVDGTLLDFLAAEREAIKTCFSLFGLGECTDEMIAQYSAINVRWWQALERGDIRRDAVCFCFVEQVHAEQNMRRYLRNLNQQIEISLQAGGIADYDDRLGITEADEIARGGFLLGICRQGIAPGQVDKRTARIAAVACGKPDGFARPVSRVLIQPRQIIENRAFAYIRIARERDSSARNFRFIRYALSRRAACQSHFHPPSVKFCVHPAAVEQ